MTKKMIMTYDQSFMYVLLNYQTLLIGKDNTLIGGKKPFEPIDPDVPYEIWWLLETKQRRRKRDGMGRT